MVIEWLLVVCFTMLGGIYGVFWRESRRNGTSVRRHDVASVPERGTTFLLGSGLGEFAGYDRRRARR